MSYQDIESSLDQGNPVELYEFVQGTKRTLYSSNANGITKEGIFYQPMPISRDRIKQSSDVFKDSLKLDFPRGDQFANQYIGFAPEDVTTVTIFRGHENDPLKQFIVYWKGRVVGAKASGNKINVECESVFTSIKRPGLRARFEYGCRHTLYLPGCFVSKEAHKANGYVIGITRGVDIQVLAASAKPDGYYTGGMITTQDGTARWITHHVGQILTISRPIHGLSQGASLDLYPGCDHLKETCRIKFNNLDNFGGFPYIPTKNPFGGSSIA